MKPLWPPIFILSWEGSSSCKPRHNGFRSAAVCVYTQPCVSMACDARWSACLHEKHARSWQRSELAVLGCCAAMICSRQEQVQVTLMNLVLATCSSFDCMADAYDRRAVSCTCRQTKVVIPASTILRTCASPLSRDLCKQQLILDTTFNSSEANCNKCVFVRRVKPPKLQRLSTAGTLLPYRNNLKANDEQNRSVTTHGHRLGST